jgi:hypothetical protein
MRNARSRRRQLKCCFGKKRERNRKTPENDMSLVFWLRRALEGSRPVTRRLREVAGGIDKAAADLAKATPPHYVDSNHILSE